MKVKIRGKMYSQTLNQCDTIYTQYKTVQFQHHRAFDLKKERGNAEGWGKLSVLEERG